MRKLFFFILLLFSFIFPSKKVNAQSRLGIYIGGGATWYYGDMNDRILANKKLFRTYFNGGLLYRLLPNLDVLGNITIGKIVGADSLAIQDFNLKRNLSFESKIFEGSVLFNFHLAGKNSSNRRIINPYIIAGVGYLKFNPQAELNGEKIDLQPLGTEGQNVIGRGYQKPYKLYTLSIPFGIGIEFPLSNTFSLRLEYANHFTLTDYIDDLSTKYPDSLALSNAPNGALAVEMSSNLVKGFPNEGYGRGNPKQHDSFSTFGVSILYTPAFSNGGGGKSRGSRNKGVIEKKKKRKKNCPAFN